MDTALKDPPMAKAKGRPRKPTGEGTQIRIDSDLASMARYLASFHHIPLSEYVSNLLRPLIVREFREAGRKLGGER